MKQKATMQTVREQLPGPYVNIRYHVQWLLEDNTVRRPEPSVLEFPQPGAFTAAGKQYASWEQLWAEKTDRWGERCRDIHGRNVLAVRERFPCFDSYDALYENRYYRWFFVREGDRLTCVHCVDGQKTLQVTEDVRDINERSWKLMNEHGWQG